MITKKFKLNIPLVICITIFMLISVLTIYSAMSYLPNYLGNLALKQFVWYIIGFIFVVIIIKITNKTIYQYAWYIYITNILLLCIVLIFGQPINGSKCWFVIPGIGSFQPSEFMKISLIIITSYICSKWFDNCNNRITFRDEIKLFIKIGIIFIVPALLTFLEPDTGAVFIYTIIIFFILWVSPIRKRWFFIFFLMILIFLSIFLGIYFFNQEFFVDLFGTNLFYRIDRLLDWKNGSGLQLENSLTAIGSSGLLGHGYNNTPIYFPESGTDFIFAVYANNFGFIGSSLLFLLILYFDYNLVLIYKQCKKSSNKFMISGIIGMLLYQQLQNIGMTLGILPITGITLPFISYGGSSLISYMIIIGIILNIHHINKTNIN